MVLGYPGQVMFYQALRARWTTGRFLCIGLDPYLERIPECFRRGSPSVEETLVSFNRAVIDATHDLVCAYKPNAAYFEALGEAGLRALIRTVHYLKETYPEISVLLDAKRADIGETNAAYATAAFDIIGADAMTVHPWFGRQALEPILDRADKGVIVMGANSNPGAGEFQDLPIGPESEPLAVYVARSVATSWNRLGNCGVTVGATNPGRMAEVRAAVGDMPLLVLGLGAQGGDLTRAIQAGRDSQGAGMIVSTSRVVLYAAPLDASRDTVHDLVRQAAHRFNTAIASVPFT